MSDWIFNKFIQTNSSIAPALMHCLHLAYHYLGYSIWYKNVFTESQLKQNLTYYIFQKYKPSQESRWLTDFSFSFTISKWNTALELASFLADNLPLVLTLMEAYHLTLSNSYSMAVLETRKQFFFLVQRIEKAI